MLVVVCKRWDREEERDGEKVARKVEGPIRE